MLKHPRSIYTRKKLVGAGALAAALITLAAVWASEAAAPQIVTLSSLTFDDCALSLCRSADEALTLQIKDSTSASSHTLPLILRWGPDTRLHSALHMAARGPASSSVSQIAVEFSVTEHNTVKSVLIPLQRSSQWTVAAEWTVEQYNHEERGEKNELQSVEFTDAGHIIRSVKRENVEGIETDCGMACKCRVWQSKTVYTQELEEFAWDPPVNSLVLKHYKKWYLTQPGENILSVAKKLELVNFTKLYYLNPGLQNATILNDGTRILVDQR